MTDKDIADKVYIEPLTVPVLEKIIEKEKPDSILPTLGGQAGLNLAMEIAETDFLEKHECRLIGTTSETIKKAEDRLEFKETMEKIGEPCAPSLVVENVEDGIAFTNKIGYRTYILITSTPLPLPKFRFGKMHFSITIINIFLPPHKRIMKPIIMCSFLISTIRIIEHFHQTIRINIVNRIISTISIRVL